jgi:glycosyltransferase involved in cell wall biosynthesis
VSGEATATLPPRAGPVRVSVVLPARNEGHHIHANLVRVCEALAAADVEVIVVDDGSQDATAAEARRAAAAGLPVRVVRLDANQGKGAALFRGFAEARAGVVAFLDADLEIAPQNVLRLLSVMESSQAAVVVGKKTGDGFPLARRLLSRIFRGTVSSLFGLSVSDTQTGIKLFRREVLERVAPRMSISRFAFDIELLVAVTRFGYEIAECPVTAEFRREGRLGRLGLSHQLQMLADLVRIYYRASFWSWLNPGLAARAWMIVFVLGVFLFGVGVAKLLTPVVLQPPVRQVFRVIALQFLPPLLRDWLVLVGGGCLVAVSLVKLNKILLAAFARRDAGAGLADLLRR